MSKISLYYMTIAAALGGLLFGYDTGVIAGALPFVAQELHLTTRMQEILVSSVVLGALLGAIMSGRLTDHYGRRKILMLAATAFILGTLFSVFAHSTDVLLSGRFIIGLAIGVTSYATPLFISEIAPARLRGSLVLINAVTITGGEALAFLVGYLFTPTQAWRAMFFVGLIPALALLISMLKLPETPIWLYAQKNKLILSTPTLQHLWQQLLSNKNRPALWIGIMLGIFQQFFGINTVMYYGPTIFHVLGFQGTTNAILATFGMGIVNMIFSVLCVLTIDKIGRRTLLLTGSALAGVSLLCIGMLQSNTQHSLTAQWFALGAMVTYIAGYCISVGSLFWLIIAEIFPLSVRGLGMSIATAVQWGANFLVSITFLSIVKTIGPAHTFWLYASICGLCVIYCYWSVPETKGFSLEEIEQHWVKRKRGEMRINRSVTESPLP